MAYAGQLIENPRSGVRITFRETATAAGGELLVIDLELAPGGRMPAGLHVHPQAGGALRGSARADAVSCAPRADLRRSGGGRRVPPGVLHDWANVGQETAVVRVEVPPALAMERLSETAIAVAQEGHTFANGMPKPMDLALVMRHFEREVQAVFPPLWVQQIVVAPLAWVAERRGHTARYRAEPAIASDPVSTAGGGEIAGGNGVSMKESRSPASAAP